MTEISNFNKHFESLIWALQLNHNHTRLVGDLAPVVRRPNNAIHRRDKSLSSGIVWFVLLTLIHWIAIYPVHGVIPPSNNRGQNFQLLESPINVLLIWSAAGWFVWKSGIIKSSLCRANSWVGGWSTNNLLWNSMTRLGTFGKRVSI